MSAYFWSDHNQLYPAKHTRFVLNIFSSLSVEFTVTATFQCLFQPTFSTHKPVSQPSTRRPSSGRAQSSGVQPRTTIASKRRLLSTGTRESGKVQKSRSKLVLFVTMTTEKATKNQLFQRLLRIGFYFGQCMVKVLLVFCCKEWLWCSVVVFWLEPQHFSGLKYWNMCRNQFITARQEWLRFHIRCLKEQRLQAYTKLLISCSFLP